MAAQRRHQRRERGKGGVFCGSALHLPRLFKAKACAGRKLAPIRCPYPRFQVRTDLDRQMAASRRKFCLGSDLAYTTPSLRGGDRPAKSGTIPLLRNRPLLMLGGPRLNSFA